MNSDAHGLMKGSEPMAAFARAGWQRACEAAHLAGEVSACFKALAAAYAEPHRRYHTAQHIGECLQVFDAARHLAGNATAVELAIWFHDAVYDPRASDNEERSALLAGEWLAKLGATEPLMAQVQRLVMATKHHDPALDADAPLMVDVDLSILAKPAERIASFESQVREEHASVPDAVFAAKRAEILQGFLDRPRLYATVWFYERCESAARRNLEQAIGNLRELARRGSQPSTTEEHR